MKWTGFGQVANHLAPLARFRLGAGGVVSGAGVPPLYHQALELVAVDKQYLDRRRDKMA